MEFEKYFQSYEDYFWEWDNEVYSPEDFFETITIPKGQTIAYERLVFETLELLSEDGIPPFGSFLLAIIATNPESAVAIESIHEIVKGKVKQNNFPDKNLFRLGATIDFMKLLAYLPDEYKTGNKRILLFQTIFKDCHKRISKDKAKKILEEYKNNKHQLTALGPKIPFNDANFTKDFRTLALLKAKFPSAQSIINAMNSVPEEAVKEEIGEAVVEQDIISDKPKDFIDELIANDKTFHVGSIIKRIWSGLNIPLHHNMPSQQPLGGVADLTNKGDFDKLLLSEFANDDDVFMFRLANNEALYIQREVPPEADKFTRIILIDSSLKNWGNPKILAFATALAIAKHPKTDISCQLFVLGQEFEEVHFNEVNTVINGLNKLSGTLDCSEGLNSYLSSNDVSNKDHEIFFITSEDSLKLVPIQRAMSDHFDAIKYVVTTNYDGNINFYRNQNKGRKHIQHILLPLEELWERKDKKENTYLEKRIINDEGIVFTYPILFYIQYHNTHKFIIKKDLYVITPENKIFKNHINKKDPLTSLRFEIVFDHLDKRTNKCCLGISEGNYFFLKYDYLTNEFSLKNLNDNKVKTTHYTFKSEDYSFNKLLFKVLSTKSFFYFLDNKKVFIVDYYGEQLSILESNINVERFKQDYNDDVNKINEFQKNWYDINLLKKLVRIYINIDNEIVFNTFTLCIGKAHNNDSFLSLKKHSGKNTKLRASFKNDKFYFPDGSAIYQNKSGMLILVSSLKIIPHIYMPLVLNSTIALATDKEFAGDSTFLPEYNNLKCISIEEFIEKHIKPFIQNILDYGA